ncbi:MAG: hypothetical protein IT319_18390 [Anaerolineae bacterium]|nr:hypothetical protein [Anaerolineae bacterium]
MSALTPHLPLALIMIGAVIWLFIIAAWKPQWFRQTTSSLALWSAVEGVICALIWTLCMPIIEQSLGVTGMLDGAIVGLGWGGMSFYGKTRFRADQFYEDGERLRRIFWR